MQLITCIYYTIDFLFSVPGCGGFLNVTEAVQTVTSPGYPGEYMNNLNCVWTMAAPMGSRIWMNISYIDVETHSTCVYDVLTLFDCEFEEISIIFLH